VDISGYSESQTQNNAQNAIHHTGINQEGRIRNEKPKHKTKPKTNRYN